ncbi:MAG TPA: hypothetical protein VM286_02480 [Candidatus Thermoplasmatota archaeon]|nr:hypothetical protein [Candidatus Thermoplasmatota archaeon]
MNRNTNRKTSHGNRSKGFLARSPEQTRQQMSDNVRRGVAVVTGVVEGFATEIKEGDLPGNAEKAVHLTGQTARRFAETGAYELAKTKRRIKTASQGLSMGRGKKVASRGGRSKRSRASAVGKLKRKVARKMPAIKRKVAPKKAAIKRKVKSAKRSISRKT